MSEVKVKVAIIGGGPAGLAAAIEGARLGLRVDLFERDRVGDHIRCAEGLFDSLHLLGRPENGVRFKVDQVVLKVNREFLVDCHSIWLWMIDRREWQCHLAKQATDAGSNIVENTRVTQSDLQALQQDYDWVIDSSGVPSLTSLQQGFRDYYRRYGAVTCQYQLAGDFSRIGQRLKFAVFPHYRGYYWIFPKGKDSRGVELANVGIGWFPGAREQELSSSWMWEQLDQVLVEEQIDGRILRKHGGIIPVKLREHLQYGNLLLTGDAAGGGSALHAGGIDIAHLTGKLAARWIAAQERSAGKQCDFSKLVWQVLRPKLNLERRICALWEQLDSQELDKLAGLVLIGCQDGGLSVLARHGWLPTRNIKNGLRLRSGLYRGKW